MHRNTFILITFLAVIAALLVGFNFGKKYYPPTETLQPTPTMVVSPTQKPTPLTNYTNNYCKLSLSYPETMTVSEPATGSAKFTTTTDTVILACQKDIPRIAANEEQQETIKIGSVSGTLYHTAAPKDGTPIDVFMIRHPKTGMDILISGVGSALDTVVNSLTLTQ